MMDRIPNIASTCSETPLDHKLCIICQNKDTGKSIVASPSSDSVVKVLEAISKRAENNEGYYVNLNAKIKAESLSQIIYHCECHKNIGNIYLAKKKHC